MFCCLSYTCSLLRLVFLQLCMRKSSGTLSMFGLMPPGKHQLRYVQVPFFGTQKVLRSVGECSSQIGLLTVSQWIVSSRKCN
jgi:hypothetical protein